MKNILKRIGFIVGCLSILLLIIGLYLLRKGFYAYDFASYPAPAHRSMTWKEVFAHPTPIDVIPLSTGFQIYDRYPENPKGAVDRYQPTEMIAFLIRHPKHGDILIDTGLDGSFASHHFGNYPAGVKLFLTVKNKPPIRQEPGHDIASQLTRHNAQVQSVFFTHLHPDHMAGIPALPWDIPYVFATDELDFMTKALLVEYYFKDRPHVQVLPIKNFAGISPFAHCADVLADGSLWAISTPGHTPGHLSYVVNSTPEPVLITGDAALYYWGLEQNTGGADFDADRELILSTTRPQLLEFIRAHPTMKVLVSHEML